MSIRRRPELLNARGQPAFIIDYRDEYGRRKQVKTEALTLKEAQGIEAAIRTKIEKAKALGVPQQALTGMTFGRFVDEVYLPAIGQKIRPSTLEGYTVTAEDLKAYFGTMALASIEPTVLDGFFEKRKKDLGPGTLKNRLTQLNAMMKMALRKRIILSNPVDGVERWKVESAPKAALTPEQEEAVMAGLPEWCRPIAVMGFYGGMRVSEILGMKWEHLQVDPGLIYIPQENAKNGKPRFVPLTSEMEAALAPLRARRLAEGSPPWIFWNAARQAPYKRQGVYCAYARVAGRLKLGTAFHATRVTFVTDARESGKIPDGKLMAITGHADVRMLGVYTKIRPESLKGATEGLRSRKDATQTQHEAAGG